MNTKWIVFAVFVWVIGMFLGSTFEQRSGSNWAGATEETTLEYLMDAKNISYVADDTGEWNFVGFNRAYFETVWQVMTFDFTFFDDDVNSGTEMLRWIIFTPIAIGVGLGFILALLTIVNAGLDIIKP